MYVELASEWDQRFLHLAEVVASWSKDPSTKCGAVIVRPDKTICSVGYNGFPKGCSDHHKLYENRELKYARVVHAEQNAILHAREPLNGYLMYTHPAGYGPSCDRCSAHIIQAGIHTISHYYDPNSMPHWKEFMQRGLDMYEEAGVNVRHLGT